MTRILYICVCAALTAGMFVSCKNDNDEPGKGGNIQGCWYADVSGKTYAKWTYGTTWQKTVFNADGTGNTAIYYLIEDVAIACETDTFTYTANDGRLTMISTKGGRTVTTDYTSDANTLQLSDERRQLSYAKLNDAMSA